MEELRNRNITSIYRELAKILHPDLEKDPAIKHEKEELMKALTVAYEKKDLYTLITLELNWLNKREGQMEQKSDEVMKGFIEQLKIQYNQLQFEFEEMDMKPNYFPLTKLNDNEPILITPWTDMHKAFVSMETSIRADIAEISKSKSPIPKTIRELIKEKKWMMEEEMKIMNAFESYFEGML
jgi:hypothetical protein